MNKSIQYKAARNRYFKPPIGAHASCTLSTCTTAQRAHYIFVHMSHAYPTPICFPWLFPYFCYTATIPTYVLPLRPSSRVTWRRMQTQTSKAVPRPYPPHPHSYTYCYIELCRHGRPGRDTIAFIPHLDASASSICL